MPAPPVPLRWRVAIRQRLQESHYLLLLVGAEPQISQLPAVHCLGMLRRRPAGCLLAGIANLASRQRVARVVEMDYFPKGFEVAIVHVGLDEIGAWPLVHVA